MNLSLLLSTLLAAGAQPAVSAGAHFEAEATDRLLAGEELPDDYMARLRAMPPARRIEAIIFLRRSGLMAGQPWSIDALLAPATPAPEASE